MDTTPRSRTVRGGRGRGGGGDGEAEAKAAAAEAEGARLFAELKALQPPGAAVAEKEDYYNEGEGWDLAGLTSDLAISKASKEGRVTRSKRHPALDLTTD